uniref:Uncharacterized protein n=1 Tax=Strigamia maritima TaxID=126957 RepID=T1IP02_STRMM
MNLMSIKEKLIPTVKLIVPTLQQNGNKMIINGFSTIFITGIGIVLFLPVIADAKELDLLLKILVIVIGSAFLVIICIICAVCIGACLFIEKK